MKFEITEEQDEKIQKWLKTEVYPPIIAKQREEHRNPPAFMVEMWELGYPYEGAIGGGLTYEFTPNSIGCVEIVRYGNQKLDLTDYESW